MRSYVVRMALTGCSASLLGTAVAVLQVACAQEKGACAEACAEVGKWEKQSQDHVGGSLGRESGLVVR